jgi:hypothetical protein
LFLIVEIIFEILEQAPTDRDIERVASQVITSSLLLSVHLGIEASVWLELKEDCHKIVHINRSILYKWRNEHPGKAKCRELVQALCNVDMNIDAILSDGQDPMEPYVVVFLGFVIVYCCFFSSCFFVLFCSVLFLFVFLFVCYFLSSILSHRKVYLIKPYNQGHLPTCFRNTDNFKLL